VYHLLFTIGQFFRTIVIQSHKKPLEKPAILKQKYRFD